MAEDKSAGSEEVGAAEGTTVGSGQLGIPDGPKVGSEEVGVPLGATVGSEVAGARVGAGVGSEMVGAGVGSEVIGAGVGENVSSGAVGTLVLGEVVGSGVGTGVGDTDGAWKLFAKTTTISPLGATTSIGVPPTTTAIAARAGASTATTPFLNRMTAAVPSCRIHLPTESCVSALTQAFSMPPHSDGASSQHLSVTATDKPTFSAPVNRPYSTSVKSYSASK